MSGDFSRALFDAGKHYSGVLMQQGRVQLDADWNDQLAIAQHRTDSETQDVIGICGTPKQQDGFLLTPTPQGDDLLIGPGRYYVGGLMCELNPAPVLVTFPVGATSQVIVPNLLVDGRLLLQGQWVELSAEQHQAGIIVQISAVATDTLTLTLGGDVSAYQNSGKVFLKRAITYATQPDFPLPDFAVSSPPSSPVGGPVTLADGTYVVTLEAWQREVDALEDRRLRETALGGPDTTDRLQTVWQVKVFPVDGPSSPIGSPPGTETSPPSSPPDCATDFPAWDQYAAPMTGLMSARTVPPADTGNVCLLPPSAGYQRLENQLYRVEVFHGDSTLAATTIVWSRENASVASTILKIDGADVYLHDLGRDDVLGFASGQWVEIIGRDAELQGAPRFLAQILGSPDTSQAKVTLSTSASAYAGHSGLKLRRWDMSGPSVTAQGIALTPGWIDIEGGIQVRFEEGTYKTGSHWLIPARTATGEIEWPPYEDNTLHPIPQPPLGGRHHYCRLALLDVVGGIWGVQDCRDKFPALTHICADDVCYQSRCDMPGVATVQDALDQLCQASDLRFHNKHLHGWGIVCGLQVNCVEEAQGVQRRNVVVRSGYAIGCEGNDVVLDKDVELDIIDMLSTSPPSYTVPDSDYSLILDPRAPGGFRLRPYSPTSFGSFLQGTLLWQFFQNCLQNLGDFYRSQFVPSPTDPNLPVGPAQKRITSLLNLFAQLVNQTNGSFVFLSGDATNPTPDQEHSILKALYEATRNELQSKTYCAMFDDARQFPEYPYSGTGIATLFGTGFLKGSRTRLRVDPTGNRAYAFGVDSTIQVYDLGNQRLDSVLDFPGGGIVMDVAFSTDGTQLYAVSNLNNQDTILAIATVAGLQHTWSLPTTVICNILLTTLATRAAAPTSLYAVGVGQGLYELNLQNISATPNPKVTVTGAFWHLVIRNDLAYLTSGTPGSFFNQIVRVDLTSTTLPPASITYALDPTGTFQGTANDDILPGPAFKAGAPDQLYVTGRLGASGNTLLLVFPATATGNNPPPIGTPIDLGTNALVRLAFNPVTNYLMVTMEDSYLIQLIRDGALDTNRYPVQLQPISIAFALSGNTNQVYVLNYLSNTVSAIPAGLLDPQHKLDMAALVDYRTAAIEAFVDLIGHFLQYLKDCFCDQLLVNCPTCGGDEELALASISIRGNQIYKVCNFSGRKYVKSFPTVDYWLSLIPIAPLIGKAIEWLCCLALPDRLAGYQAPHAAATAAPGAPSGLKDRLSASTTRSVITSWQQTNFTSVLASSMQRVPVIGTMVGESNARKVQPPAPPAAAPLVFSDLAGKPVDETKAKLAAAGITVDHVASYDPSQLGPNVSAVVTAPETLPAGSSVTLVADQQGVVRYGVLNPPAVSALRTDLEATRKTLADTNQKLADTTQALQAHVTLVSDLRLQVQKLSDTVRTVRPATPG